MSPIIVWFRKDLRLADHPALYTACQTAQPVLGIYIYDRTWQDVRTAGAMSKAWQEQSLLSFSKRIREKGIPFVVRLGQAHEEIFKIIHETGARALYFNSCYEPPRLREDQQLSDTLKKKGIEVRSFPSFLLVEPWSLKTQSGNPYQNFTSFFKVCLSKIRAEQPLSLPKTLPSHSLKGFTLDKELALPSLPKNHLPPLPSNWIPGEEQAITRLSQFLHQSLSTYTSTRDRPDLEGTSKLSPYLHFGEISPRQIWHAVSKADVPKEQRLAFLREICWREFAYHTLDAHPELYRKNLRSAFDVFPWESNESHLLSWQQGQTGYPLVDAGMRELLHTGFMHNRIRMITASFLTKHLLLPWQKGENWFWEHLVDADLANNGMNWQWVAGSGIDAAPYFRIFNPILQGEKFDPAGNYVRQYVPELSKLPTDWIHKPWLAPKEVLRQANVVLGKDYPFPLIEHKQARILALAAYHRMRKRINGEK